MLHRYTKIVDRLFGFRLKSNYATAKFDLGHWVRTVPAPWVWTAANAVRPRLASHGSRRRRQAPAGDPSGTGEG